MGMLNRLKKIIEANLNDLIDKVDDPEARINQVIRELEEGIVEMRKNTASAMASLRIAENNLEEIEKEQAEWLENAEIALKQGDEDMARKALEKKHFYAERQVFAEEQVAADKSLVDKLKTDLHKLEEKVLEARQKRETILTKIRAAETRSRIVDSSEELNKIGRNADDALGLANEAAKIEEDADRKLAQSEAHARLLDDATADSFEKKMADMKKTSKIDDELAALKAKVAGE